MTVEGYCGLFGSGKTLAMVMHAYKARQRNPDLPVMTNLGILNLPGAPVQFLQQARSQEQMFAMLNEFRCCDGFGPEGDLEHRETCNGRGALLLLDEVGVYLPARAWAKMPGELVWKWQQLRKDGIDLLWTTIRPNNVVKDLRDITSETHWCTSWRRFGFFTLRHYAYTQVNDRTCYQGRSYLFFRPGLAGKLYNTMGKVSGAHFLDGRAKLAQSEAGQAPIVTP